MTRHKITKDFSLQQRVGFNTVEINNWADKTPEGLSKFVQQELPEWKEITVIKNIIITDTQKKYGDNVVSKKQKTLTIGCVRGGSLCLFVNKDLTVNGKIPRHIYEFFGCNER